MIINHDLILSFVDKKSLKGSFELPKFPVIINIEPDQAILDQFSLIL